MRTGYQPPVGYGPGPAIGCRVEELVDGPLGQGLSGLEGAGFDTS
jgi:hypothetical protein